MQPTDDPRMDLLLSQLGEGFHTAFRKATDHEYAWGIYKMIEGLPGEHWESVLRFVAAGLEGWASPDATQKLEGQRNDLLDAARALLTAAGDGQAKLVDGPALRDRMQVLRSLVAEYARCSQCGQPWTAKACGPTHALIATEQHGAAHGSE